MSTLLEKYRQGRITAEELDLLSKEMEQISYFFAADSRALVRCWSRNGASSLHRIR